MVMGRLAGVELGWSRGIRGLGGYGGGGGVWFSVLVFWDEGSNEFRI